MVDVSSSLRCSQCSVKFESRDLLAMHMLDHSYSPGEEGSSSASKGDKPNFTFKAAGLLEMQKSGFYTSKNLHQIMSANMQDLLLSHSNSESKCEICYKVFPDRDTLAMHTLSHAHDEAACQKPGRAESYPCFYCGMVFSYKDMLLLHIMSRHKQLSGKLPLDLSAKNKLSQKRSYDSMSSVSDLNQFISRSSGTPHPSTVLATAMLSLQANSKPADNFSMEQISPKRVRTDALTHASSSHHCKTEPLTPPPSDSEMRPPRSITSSSMPPTSTSTLTSQHSSRSSPPYSLLPYLPKPRSISTDCMPHTSLGLLQTLHRGDQSDIEPASGSKSVSPTAKEKHDTTTLQQALGGNMFYVCRHCNIIFLDRAMYHLHTGLHNRNCPLQCNICGKECANPLEFSAHIIHT